MLIGGLKVPARLLALADAGIWPTAQTESSQNLKPLATVDRIRVLAPEEDQLYLYAIENFRTIANELESKHAQTRSFWETYGALDQVDPSRSLIIGDFGLGSDAAIILDYRERPTAPVVMRLKRISAANRQTQSCWCRCAESFDDYADQLQLGLG